MADGISAERGLNPFYTHTHTLTQVYTLSTAWRQQNQYCSLCLCLSVDQWVDECDRKKKEYTVCVSVCVSVCVGGVGLS